MGSEARHVRANLDDLYLFCLDAWHTCIDYSSNSHHHHHLIPLTTHYLDHHYHLLDSKFDFFQLLQLLQ